MFCLSGISFTPIIHIHTCLAPIFRGEKFDSKVQVVPVEAASTVVVTALDVFAPSCSRAHLCCIRLCRTQLSRTQL